MTEIINNFAEISDRYDAVFCDVWGCYHNGKAPLPGAVAALTAYRERGGKVVLLTNAPRPEPAVMGQLDAMNAPRESYDTIASSGGAARDAVRSGNWGKRVYHIGATKDEAFFEGADVERVTLAQAESIVCTGLANDRVETPADYEDVLAEGALRRLPLLCANPDLVVDVGDMRLFCAGALAQVYREKGGDVTEYGKPHPQIYDYARKVLTNLTGAAADDARILCIGDGIRTDVRGAIGEGFDCLFITGGLAAAEINDQSGKPEQARLDAYLADHSLSPRYAIGLLG